MPTPWEELNSLTQDGGAHIEGRTNSGWEFDADVVALSSNDGWLKIRAENGGSHWIRLNSIEVVHMVPTGERE